MAGRKQLSVGEQGTTFPIYLPARLHPSLGRTVSGTHEWLTLDQIRVVFAYITGPN